MPFYEYQCKNCGHDLEAMQKISDPPLKKCPHCGKSQLQRLMSAPVFRLKGGGWYETDFKGDQDNKRNLADRPEADAPKDAGNGAKDAGKDSTKDGAAAGVDGKGKDAKVSDGAGAKDGGGARDGAGAKDGGGARDEARAKEGGSGKEAASKDKATGTPAHKAPMSAKKGGAAKSLPRSHTAGRGKSAAKRPIKRPVHKASRRG
jgi:putative FmdB family regulatory protein